MSPHPASESAGEFFFDTVSVSNFALIGRLDFVVARYGLRAQVTTEVRSELLEGVAAGFDALREIDVAIDDGRLGSAVTMSVEERQILGELLRTLSPGEASCIACAKGRGGTVVTDDRAARSCCAERGVPFTGTIGILKACVTEGTLGLAEADELLQDMIAQGYFSPVRRVSDLM